MSAGRRLTPAQIAAIEADLMTPALIKDVAAQNGVHAETVRAIWARLAARRGLPIKRPTLRVSIAAPMALDPDDPGFAGDVDRSGDIAACAAHLADLRAAHPQGAPMAHPPRPAPWRSGPQPALSGAGSPALACVNH